MKCLRIFSAALLTLAVAITGAGCEPKAGEGPAEQAGKAIDKTMNKADEKLKDVAADTKKAVKDAAKDAENAVKDKKP